MKLDDFDLLSPEPIYVQTLGYIKSPTLREISKIGYQCYKYYLMLLTLTSDLYYKYIEPNKLEWFESLDIETKSQISIYDLITKNPNLLISFIDACNFFFVEKVIYLTDESVFCLYPFESIKEENEIKEFTGIINKQNFSNACDLILQRNGINKDITNEDIGNVKIKNKIMMMLEKMKKGAAELNKRKKMDQKMELSNRISALASIHNSLNMTNIWDLTIYQFQDQFARQQINSVFNISSMSVAVNGDKKNKFDITQWYKLIKD